MTTESTQDIRNKRTREWRRKIRERKSTIVWSMLACMTVTMTGVIPPRPTTIRCDDINLRRIFTHDTITPLELLSGSIFGPLIIMVVVNWITMVSSGEGETALGCFKKSFHQCRGYFTDLLLAETFGFFIVEILKTTVSEARPHFMQTCAPVLDSDLCNKNIYVEITVNNCTNPQNIKYRRLIDTMKSFPSGHALLGTISALFTIIFIQVRLKISWSRYLGIWLQLLCVVWALACCFSRIVDNKHHWWDVMAGAFIGLVTCILTVKYLCLWFDPSTSRSVKPDSPVKDNKTAHEETNVKYLTPATPIKSLISESSDNESGVEVIVSSTIKQSGKANV